MGNKVAAVETLVNALNHILGHTPRVLFQMGWQGIAAVADPLAQWRFTDDAHNERTWRFLFEVKPPSSVSTASYGQRWGDTSTQTAGHLVTNSAPAWPDDYRADATNDYARGASSDAIGTHGVSTFDGYYPVDICVHSKPSGKLDAANELYCPPAPMAYSEVLANIVEWIRAKFHDVRTTHLPMVSTYCAQQAGASDPVAADGGDVDGLLVTSTTYVNLFDSSVTSRTATSPGDLVHAQYNGRGNETKDDGKKVPCQIYVLYRVSGGGTGAFKVIGPDHVTGNNSENTTLTGSSAVWTNLTDEIYLNAASDSTTDTSTARNKLDFHAKVTTGTLYIYGWTIQQRYLL